MRAGIIASVIANMNRGKKTQVFTPRDFMPYLKAETERRQWLNAPKGAALGKKVISMFKGIAERQKR